MDYELQTIKFLYHYNYLVYLEKINDGVFIHAPKDNYTEGCKITYTWNDKQIKQTLNDKDKIFDIKWFYTIPTMILRECYLIFNMMEYDLPCGIRIDGEWLTADSYSALFPKTILTKRAQELLNYYMSTVTGYNNTIKIPKYVVSGFEFVSKNCCLKETNQ